MSKSTSPHNKEHTDILGVRVDRLDMPQSLVAITDWIDHPATSSRVVIKPYVEFITAANRNLGLQAVLNRSDFSLADGVSLQWAASYLYGKPASKPGLAKLIFSLLVRLQKADWRTQVLPERFAGINHTKPLLDAAQEAGWRVGVVGGSDPAHTMKALQQRWPDLKLVGTWGGFSQTVRSSEYTNWQRDAEFAAIVGEIRAAKCDLLLVAMGFPRQEYFMDAMKHEGLGSVMVGEGGSFDYAEMGGSKRRAPAAWRKVGLEWLWRLILEPRRLKRQMSIPRFIWAVHAQARRAYRAQKLQKP